MRAIPIAVCLVSAAIAAEPNTLSPEEKADGFRLLFDGKSLKNFRNFKQETANPLWQVKDGAFVLTAKGGGNLMTKETFNDFEFRFDFKIAADGNSGVMWHVTEDQPQPFHTGPEYQILDSFAKKGYPNELAAGNVAGALYSIIPAKPEVSKPAGDWNSAVIRVKGTAITLALNGTVTAEIDSASDGWKTKIATTKFAAWEKFNKMPEGHLVFQDHGDQVSFRNLRIKTL